MHAVIKSLKWCKGWGGGGGVGGEMFKIENKKKNFFLNQKIYNLF